MILFKIKKKKLLNIISNIYYIIKKSKISQKKNIYLIKIKNKIYFLSHDNISEIKIKLKLKNLNCKKNISIFFSIISFIKIIKNFPDCNLTLIYKNNHIFIKKSNIKYSFEVEILNYKINKTFTKKVKFKLKINSLKILLNSVYFLIKNDTSKNTILIFKKKSFKIISTDNYRIISNKMKLKLKIKIKKLIISNENIIMLNKLLKLNNNYKKITIEHNRTHLKFKVKFLELLFNLINTKNSIIINKINYYSNNNFVVNTKELQSAIKRSIIITNKQNWSKWKIYKNKLKILSNWESNKGCESLKINYKNKIINIGVISNHISDLIYSVKSDTLLFIITKKNLIILNPEIKNFKYIISTIKL